MCLGGDDKGFRKALGRGFGAWDVPGSQEGLGKKALAVVIRLWLGPPVP
jgi:hypothetical protein